MPDTPRKRRCPPDKPGGKNPFGRIAENLRRCPFYRKAQTVFAEPVPVLSQVRINALVDGKRLLMPTPGLKQGFFLLEPYTIAFPSLSWAVTLKGAATHGRIVDMAELSGMGVSLLMCGVTSVDRHGGRKGDGKGFFDLSAALLAATGALSPEWQAWAACAHAGEIVRDAKISRKPWDIGMNAILLPDEFIPLESVSAPPAIYWQKLADRIIRKNPILWALCPAKRRAAIFAAADKKRGRADKNEDKGAIEGE